MLQALLQGNGFEVAVAMNGSEALENAIASPPDLIISDILMPVMDGFVLCRQWKKHECLQNIPFIFYTATYTDSKDETFALELGADLFIVKPAEPDVFIEMILQVLEKYKQGKLQSETVDIPDEESYLKEYNQTLIRKLEDKLVQLESANKNLAIKDMAIASSISAIAITDLAGIITYANESYLKYWGISGDGLAGLSLQSLAKNPSDIADVLAQVLEQDSWMGELDVKRIDGTIFAVQGVAHVVKGPDHKNACIMVSFIDITLRRRMDREMQRTQKIESISIMAAGIAHDFNNLLTSIFGNLQLAELEISPDSAAKSYIHNAIAAFDLSKDLTRQLLMFSKGGSPLTKDVSIPQVIRASSTLSLSGSNVSAVFDFTDDLWTVKADENQLAQVFCNLIINASQAMLKGGNIFLSAKNRILQAGQVEHLPAGEYVEIAIRDEGTGIAPQIVPQIFDPFFTTKPHGSGLGLATVFSIISSHGGGIKVASTPGQGSTFTIMLPSSGHLERIELARKDEDLFGCGRVLVMDDSEVIREMAAEMLGLGGYDTMTASDGGDAIQKFRQAAVTGRTFDAVILDYTVRGGMGGLATIEELVKIGADAAIIVSTGHSAVPIQAELTAKGCHSILAKPYRMKDLLLQVKRAIKDRNGS